MTPVQAMSYVTSLLNGLADLVLRREVIALVAVIGTAVTIYKFAYKRPELLIDVVPDDVEATAFENDEADLESSFVLLLVNAGHSYAEDVQLTITCDAFNFDNEIESADAVTPDYAPPQAMFEVKSGRKTGFIGGGERHDIYLGNVVYQGDVQELYLGPAAFGEGEHRLIYTVSCRSHGPRKGHIAFEIDDGSVSVVERRYPTMRRRLKAALYWSAEQTRERRVENIDPDDVEISVEVH